MTIKSSMGSMGLLFSLSIAIASGQTAVKTAAQHPIQYYYSVPMRWKPGSHSPVVVVIESANRDFGATAREFENARGNLPFIIATPLVLTGGGPNVRDIPSYHYSPSVWSQIDRDGPWKFDDDGIAAILNDIRSVNGQSKVFITGWEAGGHTLFGLLFAHPDLFSAAAPVSPNYAGRWVGASTPSLSKMPIRCFVGSQDELWARFQGQWQRARVDAQKRGFRDLSTQTVKGKGHEPLAAAVLAWFASQR